MNALPQPVTRPGSMFDEIGSPDLDFTALPARREAVANQAFEIVAVRTRLGHAGNRVVLVVDGDEAAGERTAAMLRAAGYHAAVESTPREAARHMSGLGAPALVLLEVDLPQMSGFEFLERMRTNHRLKDTPVVLFTSHDARADLVRGFKAGADGYISKSVDGATLVAALRKLLGE